MKRITVYADFDFLSTAQEIGVTIKEIVPYKVASRANPVFSSTHFCLTRQKKVNFIVMFATKMPKFSTIKHLKTPKFSVRSF